MIRIYKEENTAER